MKPHSLKLVSTITHLGISLLILTTPSSQIMAKDLVFHWHFAHQHTFTDIATSSKRPVQRYAYYEHQSRSSVNQQHKTLNHKQNKQALAHTYATDNDQLSTFSYCQNIRKSMQRLQTERQLSWNKNTQKFSKKRNTKSLLKSLKQEWKKHCRPVVNTQFIDK